MKSLVLSLVILLSCTSALAQISIAITGRVTSNTGQPLANVAMNGLPGTPYTDSAGVYFAAVPPGWSGTVMPVKEYWYFNPQTRTYSNVTTPTHNQDYSGDPVRSIWGWVRDAATGAPVGGVCITGPLYTCCTNTDGMYALAVPLGWSGTLTPSHSGYQFSPASRTYTNVSSHQSDQNYDATPICSISGWVKVAGTGEPLSNVCMNGLPGNPLTNADGFYSMAVPYGWTGTVIPKLSGYVFNPPSWPYANVTSMQTSNNYVATPVPPSPGIPVLLAPADGASDQPLSLRLKWNRVAYAGKYWVQVSVDQQFNTTLVDDSNLSDTTRAISGLTNNTRYYWRVKAINSTGQSGWSLNRQFTTVLRPPFMVLVPSVFDANAAGGRVFVDVINTGEAELHWTTTDNADWISSNSNRYDTIEVVYERNLALTSRTAIVTVTSNATNSPLTITINQAGAPPEPRLALSATTMCVPWREGKAEFSVRNAGTGSLAWTALSNQEWAQIESGATGYDSGKVVLNIQANTGRALRTAMITVTAAGASGSPAHVTVVQDSCPPAGEVGLVYPARDEVLTADSVRLQWEHGGTTVTGYCLEVFADSTVSSLADSTLVDTTYMLRGLKRGTSYAWSVRPRNPSGWGTRSPWWHFSRLVDLPQAVILIAPQDFGRPSADSVTLRWHVGRPAVSRYCLEMAVDSNFSFRFVDSTVTDTSYIRRGLQNGVTYFWRVRSGNAAGWGPYSPAYRFSLLITGLSSSEHQGASTFQLLQNYPNPFNPSTVIGFSIPERCHVTLRVYNMLGQEVARLINGEIQAGLHNVGFDASALPSGAYFYRLEAGSFTSTKKLSILH